MDENYNAKIDKLMDAIYGEHGVRDSILKLAGHDETINESLKHIWHKLKLIEQDSKINIEKSLKELNKISEDIIQLRISQYNATAAEAALQKSSEKFRLWITIVLIAIGTLSSIGFLDYFFRA